jgi:hypothetical protein
MACGYAFFAASLVMTVTSYLVGQKYFPVKYDLKRIGAYFLIAMSLYLVECNIVFGDQILRLGFNTILLVIFFGFILVKEKADLKGLFNFKRK